MFVCVKIESLGIQYKMEELWGHASFSEILGRMRLSLGLAGWANANGCPRSSS